MPIAKDSQSYRYILEINNPLKVGFTHDKIKELASLKFKTFEYLAMADEIGEQGTPHTHVLLCFTSGVRFSTVKKRFPTAHIDAVKGSIQENLDYIRKEGKWADTTKAKTSVPGTFEELGTRPPDNRGKNALLRDLYRMVVEEGLTNFEIINRNSDYVPYMDTMNRLRTSYLQEKYKGVERPVEVTYVQGKTATGKSYDILHEHGYEQVYRVTDYQHPFDHYEMQDVLVFEEFRTSSASTSVPIGEILQYLDVYPLTLKARYANKYACYTKVYIVSNVPLEQQYLESQKHDKESWKAFLRRVKRVKEYTSLGVYTEYASVEEYYRTKQLPEYHTLFNVPNEDAFQPITGKDVPFDDEKEAEQIQLPYSD